MLYFAGFIIGFLLSGIWIAINIFLSQRLKNSEKALMFTPLLSAIIPTIIIWLLIGDYPLHFEKIIDFKVWIIAAVTLAATCVITMFRSRTKAAFAPTELMKMCVEAACMEIPQRAMMQTLVLWLLLKWNVNPLCCIPINALIWCAGILFQAFVIQKQVVIKDLIIELVSSFVFSIGIGYGFYTTRCIFLPMIMHALERFVTNYNRKTDSKSSR